MENNSNHTTGGVILWFGSLLSETSKTAFLHITNFTYILKSEYAEFPIVIEVIDELNKNFKINSIISKYNPFFIYCVLTELDKANLAMKLFLDVREIKLLLFYTQGQNSFKSTFSTKYSNNKIIIENESLKVLMAVQQFIRPQLSVMKWGRRNSLSKPATVFYERTENEINNSCEIILLDYRIYSSGFSTRSLKLEDDEGIIYNICNSSQGNIQFPQFKQSKLLEDIFSALTITFDPLVHFDKLKNLVLKSFRNKKLFDLDPISRVFFYTRDIEKTANLKELCLTMLQKFYFCEDKKFNQKVNHIFKNIENYSTDSEFRNLIEEMKYALITVLLGFSTDFHEDKNPKIIYRNCYIQEFYKLTQGSVLYFNQILDTQMKSLFNSKKKTPLNGKENIEFIIKTKNSCDEFFKRIISLTNRENTLKNKKAQIYLIFPLTRFLITNIESKNSKYYVSVDLIPNLNFIHTITSFSYNLGLERFLKVKNMTKINLKKENKKIVYQINLLKTYKEYLDQFNLSPYAIYLVNYQIGKLTFNLGEYSQANNFFHNAEIIGMQSKLQFKSEDYILIGDTHYNQAKCHNEENNFKKMKNSLDVALNFYSRVQITESTNIADIHMLYGIYYLNFENSKENALACFQKEIDIYKKLFNEETMLLAKAYNHLAFTYYHYDNFPQAVENFEKDLEISLRLLGNDHLYTAVSYYNLAALYELNDLNSTAIEYSRLSEEIITKYTKSRNKKIPNKSSTEY